MRIAYLELENIKSYAGTTRIDFTEGLNAVCGHNGSGKTTILEAIGWALFDSLPYKKDNFLREGQRSGVVRVGLIAGDGRMYEVVRHAGSSGGHYVYDLETRTRVTERKETLAWIRSQALDLDGDVDLRALFENAVGVPQGTMTGDFLKNGIARKAIFDPLLRVEEYRKAYEELNASRSLLDKQIAGTERDIAHLTEATASLPEVRESLRQTQVDLAGMRADLERENGRLEALREREIVLDALKQQIVDLGREARDAEHMSRQAVDHRARQQAAVERAAQARTAVEECASGYTAVIAARTALVDLEMQRRQRDDLSGQLTAAQVERQQLFGTIEQLDRQRMDAVEAARCAAELVDAAARQADLDTQLETAQRVVGQKQRLEREMGDASARITRTEDSMAQVDRQKQEAEEARERASASPRLQEEIDRIVGRLGEIESLKRQQAEVSTEGTELRRKMDAMDAAQERHAALSADLAQVRALAERHDGLTLGLQNLRDEQTRVQAALEYQSQARAALAERHCPLIDIRCPAVSADPALLGRMDTHEDELAGRRVALEKERQQAEPLLAQARDALQRQQSLLVELAKTEGSLDGIEDVRLRLEECRDRFRALGVQIGAKSELDAQVADLRARDARVQRDQQLAAALPALQAQLEAGRDTLERDRTFLASLRAELEIVHVQEKVVEDLQSRLSVLDNPRERQQRFLALAASLPRIEEDLKHQEAAMGEAAGRVKAISGQMQRFEDLENRIDAQNALVDLHLKAYETYMREEPVAATLPDCERGLAEAETSLKEAMEAESEARGRLEAAQREYDPALHAAVQQDIRTISQTCAALQSDIGHGEREEGRIEVALRDLEEKAARLGERQAEHARQCRTQQVLGFVRDTIKAAGPAVTGALLRNISEGANEIYAEIMDDYAAELRWDPEYEILVQRGADERQFSQLSGGEQMSAALAVRLALLREMSEVDFAFFDEPTQNMDLDRRTSLAQQIRSVRGFDQLIVISHDDTFEHHTDNIIRLQKLDQETVVETQ